MPLHQYSSDRRPPTNWDHFLAHPYSLVLSAWQVLAGGLILAMMTWSAFSVSQSLNRLPQPLLAAISVLIVVGGVSTMRGLLNDDDDLMVGWRTERTGLLLSATAWIVYTVTIVWSFPASVMTWTLTLALGAANLIRFRATQREERRTRARMAAHHQS